MNKQTIYPVEGRRIHDPQTGRLITKATVVDMDKPFWIRRVKDGDITLKAPANKEVK